MAEYNSSYEILKNCLSGSTETLRATNSTYEVLNVVHDTTDSALKVNVTNLNPLNITNTDGYASDHNITIDEIVNGKMFVVVTSGGEVTFTLPDVNELPQDGNYYQIMINHVAGLNNVKIVTSNGDKFAWGNSYFNIGSHICSFTIAGANSVMGGAWSIVRNLTIKSQYRRNATWAASNFSTQTSIPFDETNRNNQGEMINLQDGNVEPFVVIGVSYETGRIRCSKAAHNFNVGDWVTISGAVYTGKYRIDEVNVNDFWIVGDYVTIVTQTVTALYGIGVMATGTYEINYGSSINSTGGGTWNLTSNLFKNNVDLGNPYSVATGNYGGEDNSLPFVTTDLDLEEGDVIDLRLLQTNLTGNLSGASFNIKIRL